MKSLINIINKSVFLLFLFSFISFSLAGQWKVPPKAEKIKVPFEPTYEAVSAGKTIYKQKCLSCHGNPGKADFLQLNPQPTDLGSKDFQKNNSLKAVFYKFNEGKGSMPSFKNQLNQDEKWNLVFYLKSFDENFKIKGEKNKAISGNINLKVNNSDSTITAFTGSSEDDMSKEGIGIDFFVKRTFGDLKIGENIKTDKEGKVVFHFPNGIKGDENGKVTVIAKFNDEDTFGEDKKTVEVNFAEHVKYENPLNERHIWGNRASVPLWLLITYFMITGGVWAVILYVVFQITKIKKAGK